MLDWLMYHVVKLASIYDLSLLGTIPHFVMQTASTLLSSSNSSVNPLVYAFAASNFRGDFRKALGIPKNKTSSKKKSFAVMFNLKRAAKDVTCFTVQCVTNVTSLTITSSSLFIDPRKNSNYLGVFPDSRIDTAVTYKTSPRLWTVVWRILTVRLKKLLTTIESMVENKISTIFVFFLKSKIF